MFSSTKAKVVRVVVIMAAAVALGVSTQVGSALSDSNGFGPYHDPSAGYVADELAAHDCWTGEAPADMRGEIPGHVVVTVAGSDRPEYRGRHMTSKALKQIFDERLGLTVHGFCR